MVRVRNKAVILLQDERSRHLSNGQILRNYPRPWDQIEPRNIIICRINVAQWVETHFYHLALLHLVNTYRFNALDIAFP